MRWVTAIWLLSVIAGGVEDDTESFPGYFLHGVASGEPRPDGIVLWTRVTPREDKKALSLKVIWEIHESSSGASDAKWSGEAAVPSDRDNCVKLDVVGSGLSPRVWYSFRFRCGRSLSPWGHFRLPPAAGERLDELTYAIFSCANWGWGHFSAYAAAAARRPLDFWVHLGDWYYEHERGHYPDSALSARPGLEPAHELLHLQDYRLRHAVYRTDADLQRLASAAPLIAIWDDHEFANDAWMHGAENHQPETDGDFEARKVHALRAYHEWMPTRPQATLVSLEAAVGPDQGAPAEVSWVSWRRFDFGDLAAMLLLETRIAARTTQAEMTHYTVQDEIWQILVRAGVPSPNAWNDSQLQDEMLALRDKVDLHRRNASKAMLGLEQLDWVSEQLNDAGPLWRLISQPQVLQDLVEPDFEAAVQKARSQGEPLADMWTELLANLTVEGAAYSAGDHAKLVTTEIKRDLLVALAHGRFRINKNFDSWSGYVAERERLAQRIRAARQGGGDIVIYGGDSHNAWAGLLCTEEGEPVAPDFDGMSVSSPGLEHERRWMLPELEQAAWQAANPKLTWADTHSRGFMLVRLNRTHHHLEYRGVDAFAPGAEASHCLAAFEVARGAALGGTDVLRSRGCLPIVGGGLEAGGHDGSGGVLEEAAQSDLARALAAIGLPCASAGFLLGCLAFKIFCVRWDSGYKHFKEDDRARSPAAPGAQQLGRVDCT